MAKTAGEGGGSVKKPTREPLPNIKPKAKAVKGKVTRTPVTKSVQKAVRTPTKPRY